MSNITEKEISDMADKIIKVISNNTKDNIKESIVNGINYLVNKASNERKVNDVLIERSRIEGVLTGLKICKEMWAQGTVSHENIYENEIFYKEELEKLESQPQQKEESERCAQCNKVLKGVEIKKGICDECDI